MEAICRILEQSPLKTRTWKNQAGEEKLIKSLQLKLQSGNDVFIAEVNDNRAEAINANPLSKGIFYKCSFTTSVSTYKSSKSDENVSQTFIKVNYIVAL